MSNGKYFAAFKKELSFLFFRVSTRIVTFLQIFDTRGGCNTVGLRNIRNTLSFQRVEYPRSVKSLLNFCDNLHSTYIFMVVNFKL